MATTQLESMNKLCELISDIKVAMMVTQTSDGTLRSRPMTTQKPDDSGDLWFFSDKDSAKVFEIENERQVNLSYSDVDDQEYVSVSGTAKVVDDKQKIDELWNMGARAWYPDGKDDKRLTLIRVRIDYAEYWDAPSSTFVQLAGFAKAFVTGERLNNPGENKKINVR